MSAVRRGTERRFSPLAKLDGVLFAFAGVSAIWLAYLLLRVGSRPGWQSLLLIVFWVVFSYLLLPRIHRILTRLYVPGYFIGRARTSDGLLGDPVNLALLGREEQIHRSMTAAGWIRADDLSVATGRRIVTSSLGRRSYPEAPVSPLNLFDRQQDFAYQQEVAGSPSKRHHVRFWRCPDGWMLPGGYEADWLAAGTYDRSVGLSLFTFQVTHKIEQNTDVERDFIVETMTAADPSISVRVIRNFSTGYHSRNGGGDLIETDGDLPVIDLTRVEAPAAAVIVPTDSRDQRPAQTVFGAGVALLRGLVYLPLALLLILSPDSLPSLAGPEAVGVTETELRMLSIGAGIFIVVIAAIDLGLGLAVLAGRNWARILLMLACVVSTITAFIANARGREVIGLADLPIVGASILVLLALSSHRARDYAARDRDRHAVVASGPPALTPRAPAGD
ncbi:MAG: LssY C-terminal domain-containing protein [Propionibacteriaceae bacterium]